MNNYLAKLKALFLTALALLNAPSAIANILSGPEFSTSGSYIMSSTGNYCGEAYLTYRLVENSQTVQSSCAISMSFSNKPTGVYNYVLLECEYDPEVNYNFCTQIDSHSVTVARDGDANPNGDIEVRIGDYNNDGLTDIFVKSSTSSAYIVKQTIYGSFQLVTGLTSIQIDQYAKWGIATQILAYVSDLNIDGTDDMMLVGIDKHIPTASDQIIYSQYNSSVNIAPALLSTMSTSKKRFLIETLGLSQDRAYLLRTMIDNDAYSLESHGFVYAYFNTAYLQLFQMGGNGSIYVPLDENPYDDATQPSSCAFYSCQFDSVGGQWQMFVYAEVIDVTWDFSIFHPSTVSMADEIDRVESGSSTLDDLLDIFESQLGYISCNGIEDDQVDVFDNVHSFSYFKTNTCSFVVLARHLNSMSYKEAIEAGNKRIQFRANKINNEWFNPFYHSSLSDPAYSSWHSAMPLNGRLLGLHKYTDDNPQLTLLAGFVNSILSPQSVMSEIMLAQEVYSDKLEYTSVPTDSNNGYNSNSYVKGLINLVGTVIPIGVFSSLGMNRTVEVSINSLKFPGLNKPVPKSEFGR